MGTRGSIVLLTGALLAATPGSADVGFKLSAQVRQLCAIERVTVSRGRQPTVVVQSQCNAGMYRLTFVDLPASARIEAVQGNGEEATVSGASITLQPRRPGMQTAVVRLSADLQPELLGRINLEVI